jgi:DNA (cytosine-5)-methyltransferase 1
MSQRYQVVDLFAGPGGLAEGFSAFDDATGHPFGIALSVEKEASAFETLRLRSFFRQFHGHVPDAYYDYIARRISRDELQRAYPQQWTAAQREAIRAELGTTDAAARVYPRIDDIARDGRGPIVLVGGPPCQAYSLVGRARNRGNSSYVPEDDHRHFLYREYIAILQRLNPAVFVMENVKGLLSANVDGGEIFERVLEDLQNATGEDSYRVFPLGVPSRNGRNSYILQAEDHGIPQRRHRVILLGLRRDIVDRLGPITREQLALELLDQHCSVADALAGLPKLRSGLSRSDSPAAWQAAASHAFAQAANAIAIDADEGMRRIADRLSNYGLELKSRSVPARIGSDFTPVPDQRLAQWLHDPRVTVLPNHESRGHMADDLARYAFAATFAELMKRSPKAAEFPESLAPRHRSWNSGKFSDRFRVQLRDEPSTTITSHIAKDGHYFIHPDPLQCRSLTVREAARLQTFPDNYFFEGNRTQQYVQVGNAVPPLLASQIAGKVHSILSQAFRTEDRSELAA